MSELGLDSASSLELANAGSEDALPALAVDWRQVETRQVELDKVIAEADDDRASAVSKYLRGVDDEAGVGYMALPPEDLSGLQARGMRAEKLAFPKTILKNAKLAEIDLNAAVAPRCVLSEAELTGANFTDAILPNADLQGVDARGASFVNCTLVGADLTGGDFTGADFRGAYLFGVKGLNEENTRGANFAGARILVPSESLDEEAQNTLLKVLGSAFGHLGGLEAIREQVEAVRVAPDQDYSTRIASGLRLNGLVAPRLVFAGTDFTGSTMIGSVLTDANGRGAILRSARLSGVDARGAILVGADCFGLWAPGADLTGARLADADFTNANLAGAILDGVDLRYVRGLETANLGGAVLRSAMLPASLKELPPADS